MRERVLWGARLAAAALLLGVGGRARAAGNQGAGLGGTGGPPAEGAAEPGPPEVGSLMGGPSTCPHPDEVWTELGTLVPRERVTARLRAIAGPTPPVEIFDLGVSYRVIAAGRVREYRDEPRDCAHRARIAALFVALAIDPSYILAEQSPPAAPRPIPAPPPPPPIADAVPRALARLELGLTLDAGLGPDQRIAQPGVAVRLVAGRGRFAISAGLVGLAPVDTSLGGLRLHQWRVPADLGLRGQLGAHGIYGEVGLGGALLSERALDLATTASQTALEVGVRAAIGLRLAPHSRLAPFATLHAELVPDPPAVFALPRGVVGHTPLVWIGATAGASLGFF